MSPTDRWEWKGILKVKSERDQCSNGWSMLGKWAAKRSVDVDRAIFEANENGTGVTV